MACRAALVVLAFAEVVLQVLEEEVVVLAVMVTAAVNHRQGATMGRVVFRRRNHHKNWKSPLPTALSSGPQCCGGRAFKEAVAVLAPFLEQQVKASHGVGIFDCSLPTGTSPHFSPLLILRQVESAVSLVAVLLRDGVGRWG